MSINIEIQHSNLKKRSKIYYNAFLIDNDLYDDHSSCNHILLNIEHMKNYLHCKKLRQAIYYLISHGAVFKDTDTNKIVTISNINH